jgi:hypothetical protein
MKLRLMLVCLVALGLSASVAIAAPPPGKGKPASPGNSATAGKPSPSGPTCKPKVTVVLKGTLTSASATALGVDVTRANRVGRAYVEGTAETSVAVDTTTKVRRQGKKTLADLVVGDRVLVQARMCKADLKNDAMPALTASKVIAHPAKAASDQEDDD